MAGARLELSRPPWRAGAGAKLPLLIRVRSAGLRDGADERPLGFTPVIDLRAGVWPLP